MVMTMVVVVVVVVVVVIMLVELKVVLREKQEALIALFLYVMQGC